MYRHYFVKCCVPHIACCSWSRPLIHIFFSKLVQTSVAVWGELSHGTSTTCPPGAWKLHWFSGSLLYDLPADVEEICEELGAGPLFVVEHEAHNSAGATWHDMTWKSFYWLVCMCVCVCVSALGFGKLSFSGLRFFRRFCVIQHPWNLVFKHTMSSQRCFFATGMHPPRQERFESDLVQAHDASLVFLKELTGRNSSSKGGLSENGKSMEIVGSTDVNGMDGLNSLWFVII